MSRNSKAKRDKRKKKSIARQKGVSKLANFLDAPNSPEFNAIEDFINEYASRLPEGDPFKADLFDIDLSHHVLVLRAAQMGRYEFLQRIDPLFLACNDVTATDFAARAGDSPIWANELALLAQQEPSH